MDCIYECGMRCVNCHLPYKVVQLIRSINHSIIWICIMTHWNIQINIGHHAQRFQVIASSNTTMLSETVKQNNNIYSMVWVDPLVAISCYSQCPQDEKQSQINAMWLKWLKYVLLSHLVETLTNGVDRKWPTRGDSQQLSRADGGEGPEDIFEN